MNAACVNEDDVRRVRDHAAWAIVEMFQVNPPMQGNVAYAAHWCLIERFVTEQCARNLADRQKAQNEEPTL